MTKVSVIIPVYNVEKYLSSCLNSVLHQTYQDFEIICVNDGSTDRSGKILDLYAKKDHRIKVFTQSNKGQSAARNKALKVAKGEYIQFLDSDDFLHPQTLEATVWFAQKYGTDLTVFSYEQEENPGELSHSSYDRVNFKRLPHVLTDEPLYFSYAQTRTDEYGKCVGNRATVKDVLSDFGEEFGMVTTTLFRRECFNKLRFKEGVYYEDTLLMTKILRDKPKTVILPVQFYKYRKNMNSTTNVIFSEKHLISLYEVCKGVRDYYRAKKYLKDFQFFARTRIQSVCNNIVHKISQADVMTQRSLKPLFYKMLTDLAHTGCLPMYGKGSKCDFVKRMNQQNREQRVLFFDIKHPTGNMSVLKNATKKIAEHFDPCGLKYILRNKTWQNAR